MFVRVCVFLRESVCVCGHACVCTCGHKDEHNIKLKDVTQFWTCMTVVCLCVRACVFVCVSLLVLLHSSRVINPLMI